MHDPCPQTREAHLGPTCSAVDPRRPRVRRFKAGGGCSRNQRATPFKAYMEKNPGYAAYESVESIKAARLSWRRETHDQGTEGLFRNPGISTGDGPEHSQGIDAHTSLTTTSRYVRTVTERMKQAVQNLGANPGGKFGGNSGGNSPRKNTQAYVDQTGCKTANCAEIARRKHGGGSGTV